MVMRHRPTERKAVIALLEQEWEDVGDLAEAILDELMELKWHRGGWVIVHREDSATSPSYLCWGPYDTRNQAVKDIGKRIIATRSGARAMPLRVCNLDTMRDDDDTLSLLFETEGDE